MHDFIQDMEFPAVIDSTMLACSECPQKFFLEFVLRRSPIGKSIHLHAGGAMALAFETFRREWYTNRRSMDECLEIALRDFTKFWGTEVEPHEGSYKDFVNCWAAVEAYFQEHHPDRDYFQPYMKADGEPAVEFKFALPMDVLHPVTDDPIMFAGRADLLATPIDNTKVCYVLDEKTTNSLGPRWYYQWAMRGQFYGYTYAARTMGFPTKGSIVRGIAIQQTQFGFAEVVLDYTNDQLQRWWRNANRKVARLAEKYRQSLDNAADPAQLFETWDFSFGDMCTSYGGCQYTDVCVQTNPWEHLSMFERRVWNPLAKDPAAESENRLAKMAKQSLDEMAVGLEGW